MYCWHLPEAGFKQGPFDYKIPTSPPCWTLNVTSLFKMKKSLNLFPGSSQRKTFLFALLSLILKQEENSPHKGQERGQPESHGSIACPIC